MILIQTYFAVNIFMAGMYWKDNVRWSVAKPVEKVTDVALTSIVIGAGSIPLMIGAFCELCLRFSKLIKRAI